MSKPTMSPQMLVVAHAAKGFLDEAEGQRLFELARDHVALGPVVEIGSYCGKSSIYIGAGAQAGGGVLVCVDHHRGSEEHQPGEGYHDPDLLDSDIGKVDSLPQLRRNLHDAGLEDSTIIAVAGSMLAAELVTSPLGMVFIDGGHSMEAAQNDLRTWAGKVSRGGILAIHDLFPDPDEGGQAPITIYRQAAASGLFEELPGTATLGALRRL